MVWTRHVYLFLNPPLIIVDEGFQLATFVQWRVQRKSNSNPFKIIKDQATKETCWSLSSALHIQGAEKLGDDVSPYKEREISSSRCCFTRGRIDHFDPLSFVTNFLANWSKNFWFQSRTGEVEKSLATQICFQLGSFPHLRSLGSILSRILCNVHCVVTFMVCHVHKDSRCIKYPWNLKHEILLGSGCNCWDP